MSSTFEPAGSQPLPASSNNALPPGSVVGDFTIQGLVGEGGFGIVYRAFDNGMQREVALKEYMPNALARRRPEGQVELRAPQYADTFAAGRKSFVNEAQLLAQFDHKALVKVLRFFEANGTAYMVMPLYHGRTLKQLLRQSPQVDEAWLKSILSPLLDALETLHGARCFHRDVAPDNLLILDSGGPLLLDFGAARRIIGDMTQAVTVVIKPGYAPVEQYADDNSLQQGPWTDIYALAAVVRLAITGKPPATSVTRMVSDPVKPLAEVTQGYSAQFLRAIDYGLAVRPEDRPQSIAEFRHALGLDVVQQPPAPAPSPIPPSPVPAASAAPPPPSMVGTQKIAATPPPSAPPPIFGTQKTAATPPPSAPPPIFGTQKTAAAPASSPPPSMVGTQKIAAPPPPASPPPPFGTQKMAATPPPPPPPLAAEGTGPVGETVPMRSHKTLPPTPAPTMVSKPLPATPRFAPSPPRRQWLPIAIVVALMIVVVGAGYLVMQAVTSPPARETVARAPAPATPPPAPAPAPRPAPTPPAPEPAPPPVATPSPQVTPPPSPPPQATPPETVPTPAAPAPEPRPQPAPPPPQPAPSPAATPPAPSPAAPAPAPATPPPATGRVMLDIKPWGEVVVDGRARGLSPPLKVLQLPEGAHRIEVRNPAGAALVREVKVVAGGRVEIGHTFK